MLVLGIESSCDETAAAVVHNGTSLLSNVIASQIDVHSKYGGIVPEIASRKHIEAIVPVIMQALDDAGVSLGDIEGIAVTRGPGLVGSLLVGLSVAKSIAFARGIPFAGVNPHSLPSLCQGAIQSFILFRISGISVLSDKPGMTLPERHSIRPQKCSIWGIREEL